MLRLPHLGRSRWHSGQLLTFKAVRYAADSSAASRGFMDSVCTVLFRFGASPLIMDYYDLG